MLEAVEYHQSHMNALELALHAGLPNLEFLDWWDRVPITPILTQAIMSSSVTRLELHNVKLCRDFGIAEDNSHLYVGGSGWQLRRLRLGLDTYFRRDESTVLFTRSILKLTAQTLEEFVWDGSGEMRTGGTAHSLGSELIQFKRLRKLQMTGVLLADDTVLSALIPVQGSQLTTLFLDNNQGKLSPFFASRGHITMLKHLCWTDFANCEDADMCVSFLAANPQLESFRLEHPSPNLIDKRLIPLFSRRFQNLTALALVWDTVEILPSSLDRIGSIKTLQQLWLSAGRQRGTELDWRIDHECLVERLATLKQLRWFVVTRDFYAHGNEDVWSENQLKSEMWEDHHRELMAGYAMEYAKSYPMLDWVYIGQIPM